MKILMITCFMWSCLIGFSIGIDMFQGLTFHGAIMNALNPWYAMEFIEWVVLFLFLALLVVSSFYYSKQDKKTGR